ncbi:MAG: hypothetical protein V3V95_08550, partial [Thermodesulfobacteriota bacterium]
MTYRASLIDDPLKGVLGGIPKISPGERCVFSVLFGSSSAYFLARAFLQDPRPVLAILPTLEEAEEFLGDLNFFLEKGSASLFPPTERLAFEASFTHPELMARRLEVLYRLSKGESFITVTTAPTLLERLIPKDALHATTLTLKAGREYPRDELLEKLTNAGYTRVGMVEERGEMSVRGLVLDIFPPVHRVPLRIEFFADEIESIREFDPSTQRSTDSIEELLILPAREILLGAGQRSEARAKLVERADELKVEREVLEPLSNALRDGVAIPGLAPLLPYFYDSLDSLFDYLPDGALVTLVGPDGVESELDDARRAVERIEARLTEAEAFFVEPKSLFLDTNQVKQNFESFPIVEIIEGAGGGQEIGATRNPAIAGSIELKQS